METTEEIGFKDKNKGLALRDLERVRKPFDADFESLLNRLKSEDYTFRIIGFLEMQRFEEEDFLELTIGGYIESEQLTKYCDEILFGLCKGMEHVRLWRHSSAIYEDYSENALSLRDIIMHDTNASLSFALDYIDRWKYYYQLFKSLPWEN